MDTNNEFSPPPVPAETQALLEQIEALLQKPTPAEPTFAEVRAAADAGKLHAVLNSSISSGARSAYEQGLKDVFHLERRHLEDPSELRDVLRIALAKPINQTLLGLVLTAINRELLEYWAAFDAAMAAADDNAAHRAATVVFRSAGYPPLRAHRFSCLVMDKVRLERDRALTQAQSGTNNGGHADDTR